MKQITEIAKPAILSAFLLLAATTTTMAGPVALTLGNGGSTLVRFDIANPAITTSSIALSTRLDAIDFRPATGQLYGYVDATDSYYIVNFTTGVATLSTTAPVVPSSSAGLGVDFNPTIDRLRVVSDAGDNIVYNPTNGTTTLATNLFYVAGDPNFGATPRVTENAYTNSFNGAATTTQYVLDAGLNSLATLGNNTGQLGTVGAITVNGNLFDFTSNTGFDIFYSNGVNTAYAILSTASQSGVYNIDLTNARATLLGTLPTSVGLVRGLAVTPVPEPATMALLLGGLGVMAALRKRRS